MPDYTREQLRTLYLKLPSELKDWVIADETNEVIDQIFERYGLAGEKINSVSLLIRNVLYGLLPPVEFVGALEEKVGLDKDLAKRIGQEINRFVFFPIKELLAQLYQTGSASEPETKGSQAVSKTPQEEMPEPPPKRKEDSYREPVE